MRYSQFFNFCFYSVLVCVHIISYFLTLSDCFSHSNSILVWFIFGWSCHDLPLSFKPQFKPNSAFILWFVIAPHFSPLTCTQKLLVAYSELIASKRNWRLNKTHEFIPKPANKTRPHGII